MTDGEIEAALRPIFAAVLGVPVEGVGDDLAAWSCDAWDSMRHIHLVHAIEEEFGIVLAFETQMQMLTFARVKAIVGEALAPAAAGRPGD